MRKNWWKGLGVVLVFFSIVAGLFLPLKPGIQSVSPNKIVSDSVFTFSILVDNANQDAKPNAVIFQIDTGNRFTASKQVPLKYEYFNDDSAIVTGQVKISGRVFKDSVQVMDVFLKMDNYWMAYPKSFYVIQSKRWKNEIDTTKNTKLFLQYSPDSVKGFPNRPVLNESIRNLFFHVPLWFSMIVLLFVSFIYAIKYLNKPNIEFDRRSVSIVQSAILCGILGCLTGSVWARATWEVFWPADDPKLFGVAIGMLMYFAYLILRKSISDPFQKARISAVYQVFVFPLFITFIMIMPKLTQNTLHPGTGGSVGFNQYDLDNTMRMIFYPAVLGWILIFLWIASLHFRLNSLTNQYNEN